MAEFLSQWWRLSRLPVGRSADKPETQSCGSRSEIQKHFLEFLISLLFKGNCSPCLRPKVDPVMEEVLEAFAVSVKFLALI